MMKHLRLKLRLKLSTRAAASLLGMLLLAGIMLLLSTPGRSQAAALAQEPPPSDPHQGDAEQGDARLRGAVAEVVRTDAANNPHTGNALNAAINSSLLDFNLPGTQPGGLTTPLVAPVNCSGCHVGHIVDNFAGSMMANSARDPLFRAALQVANKDAKFGGDTCIRSASCRTRPGEGTAIFEISRHARRADRARRAAAGRRDASKPAR